MRFDLHTHHERCGHARGTIHDYVTYAYEQGLTAIGISDHSPYFASEVDHPHPQVAMARSAFSGYVEEVLAVKAAFAGKIEVLLGVESDFFPEHAEVYRAAYAKFPFDYIIGSVHKVDGVSIFNKQRFKALDDAGRVAAKEAYYRLIQQSVQSGMFQVLGHIDAMKAFYPAFSDIATSIVEETMRIIGHTGVAIEVNTSGKTKAVGGWYPSHAMLERAHYYGIPITFGSDAHDPARIADDFDAVEQLLYDIGYRHWTMFRAKEKVDIPFRLR